MVTTSLLWKKTPSLVYDVDALMMPFCTFLYLVCCAVVPVLSISPFASTPVHTSHHIYSGAFAASKFLQTNVKEGSRLFSSLSTRVSSSTTLSSSSLASFSAAATYDNIQRTNKIENENHKNFDYLSHWYPVSWSRDLPLDKPTKVTLFDVDYVIAKVQNKSDNSSEDVEVVAMIDICPHKAAALSEGRVTKFGKSFQCSYHGWTFDSKTGECIDIPQVAPDTNFATITANNDDISNDPNMRKRRRNSSDLKSNGIAVPAVISSEMVWIFPGGGLEDVLSAPPPPTIPELDVNGFRITSKVVRDFPIDWTILLENIMDPDHGLFAHQTKAFDLYSASKSNPMFIEEVSTNNGKGWTITSKVDATYELLQRNKELEIFVSGGNKKKERKYDKTNKDKKKIEKEEVLKATTTFVAPNLVFMGRRNDKNEANFVTAFFICPTGTGRSRFMSCAITKLPKWINVPRWLAHITLNDFLDQDTFLLATQQRHVLATESQLLFEAENSNNDRDKNTNADVNSMAIPVRKRLYKYRSPTERLGMRIGSWLDATVSRVPNRLQAIRDYGGYKSALDKLSKSREEVLDRYSQHTSICKDSMNFVKKCQTIRKYAKFSALFPLLVQFMTSVMLSSTTTSAPSQFDKKSLLISTLFKVNKSMTPSLILTIWILSAILWYLTKKLEKQFEFKYTGEYRDKDMDKIPSVWMDSL